LACVHRADVPMLGTRLDPSSPHATQFTDPAGPVNQLVSWLVRRFPASLQN
jgi:hypothetical protein